MQKIFDIGERLFFNNILICLLSYIYFNIFPINQITILIGFIFPILFFTLNLYAGYESKLLFKEAIIVGIMGCGLGIILYLFSLYVYFVIGNSNGAILLVEPYLSPIMSIIKLYYNDINIFCPAIVIVINTSLVLIGNLLKK